MKNIIDVINKNKTFIITSHIAPDGDNIGSSLAMTWFLRQIGKESYYVLDDSFPQNLKFLYENELIYTSAEIKEIINNTQYVVIVLDCGDIKRIGLEEEIIQNSTLLINIDHHQSNNKYGNHNYVVADASSTSELVYNILTNINSQLIDSKISQALYTGLVTDTGRFQYDNANQSAFIMAADLLTKGMDKQEVTRNIYQNDTFEYVKLTSKVISTLEKEGIFSYMILKQKYLQEYNIDYENTEDIVNYAINLENIELGILFKEKNESQIKVSFRSKQYINVNEIAAYFNGGGHKRAAGCTLNIKLEEAINKVLNYTREYIKLNGWNN